MPSSTHWILTNQQPLRPGIRCPSYLAPIIDLALRLRTGDEFGIPRAAGAGVGGVLRGRRYG